MTDATNAPTDANATTDADHNTMTGDKRTLGEMSHTHPYTGRVFGDTQTYSRGKMVAADGGEADAVENGEENGADEDPDKLEDVDHTPPGEAEGAQAAYDRGNEDE